MERVKELEAEIARLKVDLSGLDELIGAQRTQIEQAKADRKTVEEERDRLRQTVDGVKALAEEGEAYRADLCAEITRLGRLVGAEREAAVVAGALSKSGVAALKGVRDEYQTRVDQAFPVRSVGEPAPPPAGESGKGEALAEAGAIPANRFGFGVL